MKTISNILILLFLWNCIAAQNNNLENSKYNCTISLTSQHILMKGEIYSVNDSAIVLKHKGPGKLFSKPGPILDTIFATQIDKIVIEKKTAFVSKVIMYGIIGTASCAVAASGEDFDAGIISSKSTQFSELTQDNVTLYDSANASVNILSFGQGIFGTLIDVISGSKKSVIPINGKIENYIQWRSEIESYKKKN